MMLSARIQDARELNAARIINTVHRILKGFCTQSWHINNTVYRTPKGLCTQSGRILVDPSIGRFSWTMNVLTDGGSRFISTGLDTLRILYPKWAYSCGPQEQEILVDNALHLHCRI